MAETDRIEQPETNQELDTANLRPYPGTPRWVKVFGIVTLVVIVLLGIVLLSGGHGPGRHMQPGGDSAAQTPHARVTEHGGQ
jgi:hypothetical protein